MGYNFNVKTAISECTNGIVDWFRENGRGCSAVLGISGGKDSSVVAALLCEALGAERVVGVMMPNGEQPDIEDSIKLVEYLQIPNFTINIENAVNAISSQADFIKMSSQAMTNLPARIRMATLYAVAQGLPVADYKERQMIYAAGLKVSGARVINTCNMSEDWVGYSTRYGDSVGDYAPIAGFTVEEVIQIGRELGLPEELIMKTPSDGLCGKTDEDNLGFRYQDIDNVIRRNGEGVSEEVKRKIESMHLKNAFKLKVMPSFTPSPRVFKEA